MILLHENEKILSVNRKFWVAFAPIYSSAVGLILLPLILVPTLGAIFPALRQAPFLNFLFFGSFLWMWAMWIWLFWALLTYYLDILIVTNERLIHIEQRGVFHRTIAETRLSRIQDITIRVGGVFPTFLHYGDIKIRSAAEVPEFDFLQVRYPEKLKEVIMTQQRYAVAHEQSLTRPN